MDAQGDLGLLKERPLDPVRLAKQFVDLFCGQLYWDPNSEADLEICGVSLLLHV